MTNPVLATDSLGIKKVLEDRDDIDYYVVTVEPNPTNMI